MTPWAELLRVSALQLRIPPEQFWRLSLAEWRALTAQPAPETLPRAAFERLLETYPDTKA
jgi:uncharacterized phage protein (TIGR02216 family)